MNILFPFQLSAATSTSASFAVSASYLANFGVPTATASLALNLTGSNGANGFNTNITGSTGAQGDQGPAAADGLSIYLLSYTRSTCNGCAPGTLPATDAGGTCPGGGWTEYLGNGCCANPLVPY